MRFEFLIGFMVEGLAILFGAKVVRDLLLKRRGYDVNQLVTVKRSVGAATTQAGYLVGVTLGFLGAITVKGEDPSFLRVAASVAVAGLLAIALQLAADYVSDLLIFRTVADTKRIVADVNVSLAVGKAAVSVATGLVLRGAMADLESGVLTRIAWFAAAQALMVASVWLYCRLTPYDDLAEIGRNNLAAGFPIAGILLAVGFIMEAAIGGRPLDGTWQAAAADAGVFFGVSFVLVYLFRVVTDLVLLPKVKLAHAIVQEKSVAAGLQEAVSFLLAALIVTFFLH
jgi:uncharacterized membrane protein YjfL (UPF0719 family)